MGRGRAGGASPLDPPIHKIEDRFWIYSQIEFFFSKSLIFYNVKIIMRLQKFQQLNARMSHIKHTKEVYHLDLHAQNSTGTLIGYARIKLLKFFQ